MSRYDLTDFEWHAIKPHLPNKPRGVPRADDRSHSSQSASGYAVMSPRPKTTAAPAMRLINRGFLDTHSVEELANKLGMGARHLVTAVQGARRRHPAPSRGDAARPIGQKHDLGNCTSLGSNCIRGRFRQCQALQRRVPQDVQARASEYQTKPIVPLTPGSYHPATPLWPGRVLFDAQLSGLFYDS
jgi:hypothetical protein